ncbi:MAG: hypothetical protein ACKVOU_00195 [Cytophagales bacterium]
MKKLPFIISLLSITFFSCETPSQKLENAQENADAANKNLDKVQEEYLVEIENYKLETQDRIAANNQSIAEFKSRVESEKKEAKMKYLKKIAELEQKKQ